VLIGPAQNQRVMIIGGGPEGKPDKTHATERTDVVDLTAPHPAYVEGPPLCLGRMHLNSVLLPDRTVFVSGGSLKQESEPLARLQAELYEPTADAWRLMATATVPRLYHSTALLLPDARVLAAGGNPEGGQSVTWLPPDPEEEMRLEVFSPPYLFRGPRPIISAAPDACRHGDSITVATPQAATIRWVSLVRNGVTTHSFDAGQRLVDAPLTARGAKSLTVAVTGNPDLAPPGWYMLFLVDNQGVPSEAHWIHVS
ncbi:MAG TPA: galactose oxidase early set domain-containing protein, partial [Pseudonocardia sp.]|nr:galactose oxidase early set domain-containing protein [Pseudonocardia sp.]